MARASDFIKFTNPVDQSNYQVELPAPDTGNFRPAQVLVIDPTTGKAALCDFATAAHRILPIFISIIDVLNRDDANDAIRNPDGSVGDSVTTVHCPGAIAYVKASEVFSDTGTYGQPAPGDYLLKSLTAPGKLIAVTPTERAALVTATTIARDEVEGLTVGRVLKAADSSNFVQVVFDRM